MKKLLITGISFLFILSGISAQEKQRNWALNGFLQELTNVWIPPDNQNWMTMATVKNRFDFRWYPRDSWSFHGGVQNVFNYGQIVQMNYPYYGEFSTLDPGFFNLTKLWVNDSSYFFYSNIDRLNVKYSKGNLEATVGRQRINWGINLVWTPNDIFNSFNYFDFDYVERPGSDAILVEYYTGMTSSVQFAFKMDKDDEITSAIMYRFNKWNYDFQAFAGLMEDDLAAGLGWSGDIKGAGFNGEASYFIDRHKFADTNGVIVASAGLNYTLSKRWYFHTSYLFNSAGTTGPAGWGSVFTLYLDINAKTFTLAKHSLFAEVRYPVTPLINLSVSSIWNPNDKSGYAGPSVDISLTDNISLFFISQIFWGNTGTEFGDYGAFNYLRLKWAF